MESLLAQKINARLNETGKSARSVSIEATGNPDTIRHLLKGRQKSITGENLIRLADALGTTVSYLVGENEGVAVDKGAIDLQQAKRHSQATITNHSRQDIPIMGTAAGSAIGSFVIEGGPVDFTYRPPGLAQARDIYAIYIAGNSMSPAHNPGDLRFVNPHKPHRVGDDVIIQTKNGEGKAIEASIGRFKSKDSEFITIEKLNPTNTQVKFKVEFTIAIHRVLTTNELFAA